MRRSLAFILAACLLFTLSSPARALDVQQVLWGFDGHVVANHFNPVWVLISNPTADAFLGTLTLRDESLAGSPLALRVEATLSPGSRRWVEFVPMVYGPQHDWSLSWAGTGRGHLTLDPVDNGAPARVALTDSHSLRGPPGIHSFPEDRFPASVTDLDTLDSVVLDHMPPWEPLQRQAFMAWLAKGGTLHLGTDDAGHPPEFLDELTLLNTPRDRFNVGNGLVVRHGMPGRRITDDILTRAGFPLPALPPTLPPTMGDATLAGGLREFTNPDHNWFLILGLGAAYLGLLGPVNWLVSRKVRDYRTTLLFLIALIALFCAVFFYTGRRGFGETAATYTLTEARPLPDGTWDATQWSCIFVTSGGRYDLTHASPHNLYAVPMETDAVNGQIFNGKDGHFDVDIPLFSSHKLMHRGQFPAPYTFDAAVLRWTQKNHDGPLTLSVSQGFPAKPLAIWARANGAFWALNRAPDGTLVQAAPLAINPSEVEQSRYRNSMFGMGEDHQPRTPAWFDNRFALLANLAMARDDPAMVANPYAWFNGNGGPTAQPNAGRPPATLEPLVHLYVLDRAPADLAIHAPGLGKETGYVLVHQVIRLPED